MTSFLGGAHLHLLVNHAPVFGAVFALALLVVSYVYAGDVLRRTGLVVLIATGVAAGLSDLSGDPAAHAVQGLPGVQRTIVRAHDSFAGKSFAVSALVGLLALAALVRWRRAPIPNGVAAGGLLGAALVSGLMAYTALLGGRIRHTEVRPGATPADAAAIEPPPPPRSARPPG